FEDPVVRLTVRSGYILFDDPFQGNDNWIEIHRGLKADLYLRMKTISKKIIEKFKFLTKDQVDRKRDVIIQENGNCLNFLPRTDVLSPWKRFKSFKFKFESFGLSESERLLLVYQKVMGDNTLDTLDVGYLLKNGGLRKMRDYHWKRAASIRVDHLTSKSLVRF